MTKRQVVKALAIKLDITEEASSFIMEELLGLIRDELVLGESVRLSHLGEFFVRIKAPRLARNPWTGETIQVPQRRKIGFRPSPFFCKQLTDNSPRVVEDVEQ